MSECERGTSTVTCACGTQHHADHADHADHALCGSGREHHMACSTRTELLGNDENAVAVLQDGGLAGKGSVLTVCVRRRDERYKWEIRMARLLQGMYPFPPNQIKITHFGFVKM